MPQLSAKKPDSRFMGLFVGKSGSGKKSAIASFADAGPVHIMDFDGRIDGILGSKFITQEQRDKISYEYYPPKADEPTIVKIQRDMQMMLVQMKSGSLPFKTLAICSLTGVARNLLFDGIKFTHPGDPGQKGMWAGTMAIEEPGDYKYESTGVANVMTFLRSMPCNVIVCAHLADVWGKPEQLNNKGEIIVNQYAQSIVTGEKLALRDKIADSIGIYFNHIFKFEKRMVGIEPRHYVRFRTELARTTFSQLPNGEVDITNKSLYPYMMNLVKPEELEKIA